jgi:hypothetical protein
MSHFRNVVIAAISSIAISANAVASVFIWSVESGGNGHAYEAFLNVGITWDDANAASQLASYNGVAGHLATVTDGVESYFVTSYITDLFFLDRVWLGGRQSDPAAAAAEGWSWVTGETWDYTNWALGDPDDGGVPASESHLAMICPDPQGPVSEWLDFNGDASSPLISGYLVEYDIPAPGTAWLLIAAIIAGRRNRRRRI